MKPVEQLVNAQNLQELKLENPSMMMHPNAFATHCGLSAGIVGSWIDSGYLPTVKVGKYRMINLLKLRELLLSPQPNFTGLREC